RFPAGFRGCSAESVRPRTAAPRLGPSSWLLVSEDPPLKGARRPTVLHRRRTVHQDPVDSFGVAVGIVLEWIGVGPLVCRPVPDARQVEDDEVRPGSGSNESAVGEAQPRRRTAGHLVPRFLAM